MLVSLADCTGEVGVPASPSDNGSESSDAEVGRVMPTSGPLAGTSGASGATSGATASSGIRAAGGSGSSPEAGSIASSGTSYHPADGGTAASLCDVLDLLATRCDSCHSSPPLPPAPMSLVSYADLRAPALEDPMKSYAQMSVLRMQNTLLPMPPAPAAPATAAEIAIIQSWIAAGDPYANCSPPDAGASANPLSDASPSDASIGGSDYDGPLVCSSGKTYTSGHGSTMRPGDVCQSCHGFKIAGTVYATEHEPLFCDGVNVPGASVVITGANGAATTIPINNVGNFDTNTTIALPFRAKVIYDGGERDMLTPQTIGACNSCHTANGANAAPGRIMLP